MSLAELIWNQGGLWYLAAGLLISILIAWPALIRGKDKLILIALLANILLLAASYQLHWLNLAVFFAYSALGVVGIPLLAMWQPSFDQQHHFRRALTWLSVGMALVLYLLV